MQITIGRRGIVLLALAGAFIIGAGVAYAAIPSSSGVYTACLYKNLGTIRLIDPSIQHASILPLGHCLSDETQITWGQTGPQGIQGPQGPQGS
jgi:hypothetical protein